MVLKRKQVPVHRLHDDDDAGAAGAAYKRSVFVNYISLEGSVFALKW